MQLTSSSEKSQYLGSGPVEGRHPSLIVLTFCSLLVKAATEDENYIESRRTNFQKKVQIPDVSKIPHIERQLSQMPDMVPNCHHQWR